MSVTTRTLTINAAFLQEIKEDNQRLRELLQELREANQARVLALPVVAQFIAQLRDQLATHFALEEAFGYFEDPLRIAPHLCDQAEDLRNQHGELYARISDLAEQADECSRRPQSAMPEAIWDELAAFNAALEDHEAQENQLIMSAFNVDIGVGD